MTILESNELFHQGDWRITQETADLPDGRTKQALVVHRCDSVHILAFNDADEILLLREYRPFLSNYVWMLPSGKADKETDMLEAAKRELREETGFDARSLKHFYTSFYSDTLRIQNHVFIAKDLFHNALPQDESEMIEVHALPLRDAIRKIQTCPHIHGVSLGALLRYDREQ